MKVVILAGGLGSRLSEETVLRPKPMVEIGGRPILWHIMKIYAAYGVTEFIVALGYKAEIVKEYFLNFYALNSDLSINLGTGESTFHNGAAPNWMIHLVDTGAATQTGGRLKRLRDWIGNDPFFFTYGDCLGDLDIGRLREFHESHGKLATVTTVLPPERFGRLSMQGDQVVDFYEKKQKGDNWINGGYFVLNPAVLDYIAGDDTAWEKDPVEALARAGELMGYRHDGFWSPMDTLKEKNYLEELWRSGNPPWRIWGRDDGTRNGQENRRALDSVQSR